MNNTIYYDAQLTDDERRKLIFEGQLVAYSPREHSLALVGHARKLIEEAFAPLDPETAQYHMPVEQYAEVLGKLKPHFIHHPESKKHLKGLLAEMGADPEKTYFDVPKMRSSTSDNYLRIGVGSLKICSRRKGVRVCKPSVEHSGSNSLSEQSRVNRPCNPDPSGTKPSSSETSPSHSSPTPEAASTECRGRRGIHVCSKDPSPSHSWQNPIHSLGEINSRTRIESDVVQG